MRLDLAPQQAGDEEAGDDEEHVDADVPAPHRTGVVEDDGQDRDRAQTFDVAPERVRHLLGNHAIRDWLGDRHDRPEDRRRCRPSRVKDATGDARCTRYWRREHAGPRGSRVS